MGNGARALAPAPFLRPRRSRPPPLSWVNSNWRGFHSPRRLYEALRKQAETQGWTYLTGQRRLRKIPNVQYDVPFQYTNGNTNWDDSYGFNGATDRYDWKLVGKKEVYIPYNNNNMTYVEDLDQLMGPQYVNPDHVRFVQERWLNEVTGQDESMKWPD